MPDIKFHKPSVLPGVLLPNSMYFVENGNIAESYLTNNAGVAKSMGNSAMINSLADARVAVGLANLNSVEIVANITARNVLSANNKNQLILVTDATGDPTVASGAALYAFRNSDNAFIKLTEYESVDFVVQWSNIVGIPTSAASLIDDAVSKRHEHSNKVVLDKFAEVGGLPTYDGQTIGGTPGWTVTDW